MTKRAAVDPALAEADHRQASAGGCGGVAAPAADYERQERRGLRINRAFRLALRPCLPTGAGDALSRPRRGSPPFEAHKGNPRSQPRSQPAAGRHHCSLSRPSLSSFMSFACTGLAIPSFFILVMRLVRLRPSRAAAPRGPPTTHPVPRKACKIRSRWESQKVPGAGVGATGTRIGATGFASGLRKGFGSTPLSARITARSIRFWSSRTLPGQEYEANASTVSCGI